MLILLLTVSFVNIAVLIICAVPVRAEIIVLCLTHGVFAKVTCDISVCYVGNYYPVIFMPVFLVEFCTPLGKVGFRSARFRSAVFTCSPFL